VSEKKLIEVRNCEFISFDKINLKVDASAFYPGLEQYYNDGHYPFIRVADVDNFIDYNNCIKIPEQIVETGEFSTLKKVHEGDILITKGGSIGRVALVEKEAAVTRDLIFLNSSSIKDYEYKFLYLYLSTNFCNDLMIRTSSMTAQPHLTLTLIKDLPIFDPSEKFKRYISNLYDISRKSRYDSIQLYHQAEKLLLQELGLENFNPSNEKESIKTLKESFLRTGRLDSEYYQPKYDDYLKKVLSYKNGYELLGKCCTIKDKNFMPKDDEEYRYIELANVRTNVQITDCNILLGKELPTRARRKVNTGDVIVSSIEGSLESCALITEEYNNSLCSTGFYVVNSKKLNSESLLTVFKSSLMLNLMKKGCSGTILTNIAKEEFAKFPIPLLKQGVQDEIASYIKQSMEHSKKAKELLEISTKSVEIAIDKDETAAHNFLEQNRTEQNRTEQNRTEQNRTEQNRTDTNCLL